MFKTISVIAAGLLLVGCTDPGTQSASGLDPDTGIAKRTLVQTMGIADGGETLYGIFYREDGADPAQIKAAPAKLCAAKQSTLISAEEKPLEHPEELPGVRKLMVRCK